MGELIVSHFNYWIVIVLMMMGLYVVFASGNMVKRLVGLSVFQTSVFLFYITLGKVVGGRPPILPEHGPDAGEVAGGAHAATAEQAQAHGAAGAPSDGPHFEASALDAVYSNPLPHVLILTAIVVGVATLAVGLALVVGVREAYGSIEDADISRADYDLDAAGEDA